jgi:putative DNA-invertase from lambdoid prophage Rac
LATLLSRPLSPVPQAALPPFDRLGRNYEDVCDTIREFMRRGVVIKTVINGFIFDGATKDPSAAFARSMPARCASLVASACACPSAAMKPIRASLTAFCIDNPYRGRKPSYTRKQYEMARALLAQERVNVGAIAEETGLSRQTVYRIKDDPAAAEAALTAWRL